jgi:hypothetical protein
MNRNQVQFLDLNFENVPRSLESGWETSSNVILETAVSLKHIFETPKLGVSNMCSLPAWQRLPVQGPHL